LASTSKYIRMDSILPFERSIAELENRLIDTECEQERKDIEIEIQRECDIVFPNLSAWERVQLARHAQRPRMLDYTKLIFDDMIELHGDRVLGDDLAMVTGIAQFNGETVMVVGQQKGVTTEEKVERNFGMAHPEGYRKAMRMYDMAERFKFPIISFVDTPAAHPGLEAEQHGQGPMIAQGIMRSLTVDAPIFSAVIGEGGSGGALAIAVADEIAMFEHAFYVICPPERCAEILWRDVEKKELASEALKPTAYDLKKMGIIDTIIPEPNGGAHRSPNAAAQALSESIERFLFNAKKGIFTPTTRQQKFQSMGVWAEEKEPLLKISEAADQA